MASVRKNTSASQKKPRRYWRIILLLGGFLLVVALFVVILGGLFWVLFSGNQRFTLQKVEVDSDGWWHNRERLIAQKLGLIPGQDNLFDHRLSELKRRGEGLPGVARVETSRIPPDTLRVRIIERIPRAFLGSRRSPWVVDEHAVVIESKYCLNLHGGLPIILGFNQQQQPEPGNEMPDLQPALDLIMLTILQFPEFEIVWVDIRDPDKLSFVVVYNGRHLYQVFMPKRSLESMIILLRSAIQNARQGGDYRSVIDLTFDGNVVFR